MSRLDSLLEMAANIAELIAAVKRSHDVETLDAWRAKSKWRTVAEFDTTCRLVDGHLKSLDFTDLNSDSARRKAAEAARKGEV